MIMILHLTRVRQTLKSLHKCWKSRMSPFTLPRPGAEASLAVFTGLPAQLSRFLVLVHLCLLQVWGTGVVLDATAAGAENHTRNAWDFAETLWVAQAPAWCVRTLNKLCSRDMSGTCWLPAWMRWACRPSDGPYICLDGVAFCMSHDLWWWFIVYNIPFVKCVWCACVCVWNQKCIYLYHSCCYGQSKLGTFWGRTDRLGSKLFLAQPPTLFNSE